MIRSTSFRLSCSLIALTAVALAACATHDERAAPRRHGSIKDDPADVMSRTERAPRMQKASHLIGTREPEKMTVSTPSKGVASEPSPVLPKVEAPQPPVRVVVEATTSDKIPPAKSTSDVPPPTKSAALDTRPVSPSKPVEVLPAHVEPPKTSVATPDAAVPQASRPTVVIKPVETAPPPDGRSTSETRRRPAPEMTPPPRNTAVPPVSAPSPIASPAVAPPPAAVAVPIAPPPVVQSAPSPSKAEAKPDSKADPQIAALTDDQRVAGILSSVDGYMKAGRYQNARSLLEDAAKAGHPKLLTALAETYDPLILREQYPKLARTGDPEKAIALYEQATAKGATNLAARLTALKALAGPKR